MWIGEQAPSCPDCREIESRITQDRLKAGPWTYVKTDREQVSCLESHPRYLN
jgi:hypothetical protein